ncbi:mannitol dehydrogenase family protein [uncultured Litoreibacter sp.]|uniref:mannitol dehydrogenase family protein n=1 Tax=uncultured Litoreibacter sp. TaxID=1392394 RepID=UPI00261FB018|nr:mannitol dehydrogenase family protein [uncultured Litoreibacter sp.]
MSQIGIAATTYDRDACAVGVVHLGFGAFHRAHQAVYFDDFMQTSGDLRWGIAAVNLRASEAAQFQIAKDDIAKHDGYFLKAISSDGHVELRRVRSHVSFQDWTTDREDAEGLLAQTSVHLVTITVTESGYYIDPHGDLNILDDVIATELSGGEKRSVYGYLHKALQGRMASSGARLTIACCDNIRQNGTMLKRNLMAYLVACNDNALAEWVDTHVAFPCSMVDRITPRSEPELSEEFSQITGTAVASPVMAEDFTQWVLQETTKAPTPDLTQSGVTVTADVDPYEEAKIRVLNGGHTCLTYLAALEGVVTFDAAMRLPHLHDHFCGFETQEVLPALTLDLPFSKEKYLESIGRRFANEAIGDTVARICADGMAKFPIFVRPTLEGCLRQGIMPHYSIRSIASWHQFAQHVAHGKIPFNYVEPSWDELSAMLGNDSFVTSRKLWDDLPETYPEFADNLRREIMEMEAVWPV